MQSVLSQFDAKIERIDELDVGNAIRALKPECDGWTPPLAWKAEVMAFDFCEDYPWDSHCEGAWGTYFGPLMAVKDKKGKLVGSPDISHLSPEILKYWHGRAVEARHPVLKARYSGLVWDFSHKVANMKPSIEMARARVDAVVEIAAGNLHKYETQTINMLEHAFNLACQINDHERIGKVRDAILAFEGLVGEDDAPALWALAYDLLWKNKEARLTKAQRASIIQRLEDRLTRITEGENHDPWSAEEAAVRLAEYYRASQDKQGVRRVLLKYGGAFEKLAEQAAPMLAQAWLEDVCTKYRAFGLTEETGRLLRKIHELGPKVHDCMKPICTEMTIKREDMDSYVAAMIEGSLQDALTRIAVRHLPRKDKIVQEINSMAGQFPLMSIFQSKIMDHDGRPAAVVGSVKDDLEGHIVRHMTQNMQFSALFLRQAMVGLREKFALTQDQLLAHVRQSPLFEEQREPILRAGLEAYLNGQAVHCIHLLIPQIEAAIRAIVQNGGGTVLRPNRMGGQDLRTLDDLLRDEVVCKVFGEDVPLYFRVLFTDRRGINLRNNVCHGISPAETFSVPMADRVVHALLIVSLVRMAPH